MCVLLHGSHQDKRFVNAVSTPFNEAGFAVACFDQYIRGERKVGDGLVNMLVGWRARTWKTVHDAQRLVDYLETRPDVDANRIYLVGASYGAITGTVAVARDKRFKAAALVVGGGDWDTLLASPRLQRELPGWLSPYMPMLGSFLIGPADPVLHAAGTAGTPVLMQNGTNDSVVTPAAGEALYEALGEPKEIRWYPIDHPDIEPDGEKILSLLDDGLEWLVSIDRARVAAAT